MKYKPATTLFGDGWLIVQHTVPPYMGVYAEQLLERRHGYRCHPVMGAHKATYWAIAWSIEIRRKRTKMD